MDTNTQFDTEQTLSLNCKTSAWPSNKKAHVTKVERQGKANCSVYRHTNIDFDHISSIRENPNVKLFVAVTARRKDTLLLLNRCAFLVDRV